MDQSSSTFNFNDNLDDDESDKVIIQLTSESVQINYYQLLRWSKLVRSQYPRAEINRLSDYLKRYQQLYNIKEENIKSFIKSISDERVQITNDQYFDYQKLSKIFEITIFDTMLKKYYQNHTKDLDFIIKVIKDQISFQNSDIYCKISPEMEEFLSNCIEECFTNPEFNELPAPKIYRIIEKSGKKISSDLLYDFIKKSLDKRFVLFPFLTIENLSDEKMDDLFDNLLPNENPLYFKYLKYDMHYLKKIKDEKNQLKIKIEELNFENEKCKMTNDDMIKELEKLKIDIENMTNENEELKRDKENLIIEKENLDKLIDQLQKEKNQLIPQMQPWTSLLSQLKEQIKETISWYFHKQIEKVYKSDIKQLDFQNAPFSSENTTADDEVFSKMNLENIDMMYEYGIKKFISDDPHDLQESIKCIKKAADGGHENAKLLLNLMKEDQFFGGRKASVPFDIEIIRKAFKLFYERAKDSEKEKSGYIFTLNAIIRLTKLFYFSEFGVPILLEGQTGTSKTTTAENFCKYCNKRLIKFNFSKETRSSHLIGSYKYDENSVSRVSIVFSPFIQAYQNGECLLLENIDFANDECMKFIGDAIDNGIINVKMEGIPNMEIKMHPDLRIIATKNTNKEINQSFISRFQIIDFPTLDKNELTQIVEGLTKSFNYNMSNQFIHDLIDFHMKLSSENNAQHFTVREIIATIFALIKGNNFYDAIMTIYGARYKKEQKNKIKELFLSYENFKDMKPYQFDFPPSFPECFHNKNLEEALKAILFSLHNERNVILAGQEGSGITQVARWVSKYYNNEFGSKENSDEFFCICTEETKFSDFIGSKNFSENKILGQDNIFCKPGMLIKLIEQGKCVVFDRIEEVPSTFFDRLNQLFDKKYDISYFDISENSQSIRIDSRFRMICTCRIDKIDKISPAFINRFDVIILEDQLEDITDDKLKELIEILMKIKVVIPQSLNINDDNDEDLGSLDEEEDFVIFFSDDDDDEISNNEISNNEISNNEDVSNEIEFKPSTDLINLAFESFKQIKNESLSNDDRPATMFKLSQLCKAISKYVNLFSNISEITQEKIVKFATDLVIKTKDFDVPKEIEDFFIQKLIDANYNDDGQYFFADSPSLCSFIAKIYAASIINLPLIVYGGTGVGKTSAAKAFGRLRRNQQNRNIQSLMLSFHAGTKSKNIYGTTTILNENFYFVNGPLTTALQNGGTFIADEMNLSSISTLKSLAPALETCIGENIFISSIGGSVKIHPNFFFIACQNELKTIERSVIPSSIISRFRALNYPVQQEKDISTICLNICKSFYTQPTGIHASFSREDARKVGEYMVRLNQIKQKIIPQWSFHDIVRLFKRIHHQDEEYNYYQNLSFYHNVLFYTLAPVEKNELEEIFNTIWQLVGISFNLDTDKRSELRESYYSKATIRNFGKGSYIMKGNTGISTYLFPNFKEFLSLPSLLLECIFQILLSDSSEPVLLIGPSSYKTFISKLFLQRAKVINLTQETSVSQLIGSSELFTKSEAKYFYLDLICRICHIYDRKKIAELNDKLSKRQLVKSDITSETKSSFATTVHLLIEKLFDNSTKNNDQNILSDKIIEFRPGLVLLSILQGNSIILKDLSNIQTNVIERFNELLTGKHNITISEDIHNTITNFDQKELSGFSSFFRVFGTCTPNSTAKLPEAVLSRFTVIKTSEYKKDEQENVLKSYNFINDKKLSDDIIDLILDFSQSIQNHLKMTISFTQLISILEICSRLIQNASYIPPKNILGIVLYRIFAGLLEYKEKINTIFDEIDVPLPSQFLNPMNECPFVFSNKDGFQVLESKITGLINSTNVKEANLNVAFTPSFVDMLDIIHFGICAKIPLILEGNECQGKRKAIEYVAKCLDYDVINIYILKSTKVDDLIEKISEAIKSNSRINDSIIVFHDLNNASPVVLEILSSLLNYKQSEFYFPDGTSHPKDKLNIICLFNPQNGNKLPTYLTHSLIYHIVESPKKTDILRIIEILFESTEFKHEALKFYEKYRIAKKIASQNSEISPVTLYDIDKYIIFRTITNRLFSEDLILQILFGYKFLQKEKIIQALKDLNLLNIGFQPKFIYNEDKNEICLKNSNDSEVLTLNVLDKDVEKIKTELISLTDEQQQCLFFLTCAILTKRACVIQGSTTSGKSQLIRFFAYMLGRKLNVYQMNCDSSLSILSEKSIIPSEITEKEVKEFQVAFSDLQNFDEINSFIKHNFSESQGYFKMSSELLELINKYKNEHELTDNEKGILERVEFKIRQIISAKSIKYEKSEFIKAMENGEWVVIEDLDSAPPEIEEKLSSLCGDDPEIDLFVCGKNNFFSRSKPNSSKIHENFQLFITFDPKNGSRKLSSKFLSKCFSFTLPSLKLPTKSLTEVIIGPRKYDEKFDNIFTKQIYHQKITPKDDNNNEESSNIKLYNHILWFSQVKAIIDRIFDHKNPNPIEDISKLNRFPEMQRLASFLLKKELEFFSSSEEIFSSDDISSTYSIVNANFLVKLKNDDLINNLEVLDKIFNEISLRNGTKDDKEIKWINKISNKYDQNLNIVLPQFEPQDLFYLFISLTDEREAVEGPLISSINCKRFLNSIERILYMCPVNFFESADKIAKIIYRIVFNNNDIQCNHSEFKVQFEQALQKSLSIITNKNDQENEHQNKEIHEVLMSAAIFVLDISDRLNSLTPYKLSNFHFSDLNKLILK